MIQKKPEHGFAKALPRRGQSIVFTICSSSGADCIHRCVAKDFAFGHKHAIGSWRRGNRPSVTLLHQAGASCRRKVEMSDLLCKEHFTRFSIHIEIEATST
jgi:hypothetical protein